MEEVEQKSQWDNDDEFPFDEPSHAPAPVDKLDKILETNMVIIGFLSRLYDIQMAMLNATGTDAADMVYETHESGGNLNPPIFIPDLKEE